MSEVYIDVQEYFSGKCVEDKWIEYDYHSTSTA